MIQNMLKYPGYLIITFIRQDLAAFLKKTAIYSDLTQIRQDLTRLQK